MAVFGNCGPLDFVELCHFYHGKALKAQVRFPVIFLNGLSFLLFIWSNWINIRVHSNRKTLTNSYHVKR